MPRYKREPEEEERKPGREEFKQDVHDAVKKAVRAGKKRVKKGIKVKKLAKKFGKKSKYQDLSGKELYDLVKQKRDMILEKKGIPMKIPRGRARLMEICRKIKA